MPIAVHLIKRVKKVDRFSHCKFGYESTKVHLRWKLEDDKGINNLSNYFLFLLISTFSENTLEYNATD